MLGCTAANRAYYAGSPEWEQFYQTNAVKMPFVDSDLIRDSLTTTEVLQSVGWGAGDLDMMHSWFFLDEEVFSLANMRTVAESSSRRGVAERIWMGVDGLGRVRRDPLAEIALALLVVLILIAPTLMGTWTAVVAGWYGFLALSVAVVARPMPASVYLPCLVAVVCSGLLFASASKLKVFSRRTLVVGVLLLLAPAVVGAQSVLGRSARHASRVAEFRNDWRAFTEQRPRLVGAWADAFPYALAVSHFREGVDTEAAPLVVIGALGRTPFTRFRLREAGVADLHIAMIDNPGIVLIAREEFLPILQTYLSDRYQRSVDARPAFSGGTFTAWHLVEHSKK